MQLNRISSNLMFDKAISQMAKTKDELGQLQLQLTTGKQVVKPSDAPDKSAEISRLKSSIDRQESYVNTITKVRDKLAQQENAINSASSLLYRLKELTVQAANDSYSAEDRKSIDIEVRQLRDQMLSLANTQDENGNFIFSGTRVKTLAFAFGENGKINYQGDNTVSSASIGDMSKVEINRSGTNPFNKILRINDDGSKIAVSFFEVIDDLSSSLNSNNNIEITRSVGEIESLQKGLSNNLAHIGGSLNKMENQLSVTEENILRMSSTLARIEDVDYTEAITQLNKEMLALEAAQSSFAKISQLNLFDYIR